MLKHIWSALICFVIVACNPSSIERTATNGSAKTQTETVVPATTPTPTLTQTLAPTLTQTSIPAYTPTITPIPSPTLFGGYGVDPMVAYKSNSTGPVCYYKGDILVRSIKSTTEVNLTKDIIGQKIFGGWSPNGEWIVFGLWIGDELQTTANPIETWLMRSDGSQKRRLPFNVDPNDINEISWSPDNKEFLSNCQEGTSPYGMCLMNIDDFAVTRLNVPGRNPKFSPDGKSYAWFDFQVDQGQVDRGQVYVLSKGSSTPLLLAEIDKTLTGNLIWMPDSHGLLIVAQIPGGYIVYSIAVDGKDTLHLIANLVDSDGYVVGISPDGKYLLLNLYTTISVVDLKSNKNLSIDWASYNTKLFWTPDGLLIARTNTSFFIVNLETGRPEIISNPDWISAWSKIPWSAFCLYIQN